jgi:hypothetical protein
MLKVLSIGIYEVYCCFFKVIGLLQRSLKGCTTGNPPFYLNFLNTGQKPETPLFSGGGASPCHQKIGVLIGF